MRTVRFKSSLILCISVKYKYINSSVSYYQAVQRSLEKLASKGIITEKINGKQKVYAPKQVGHIDINIFFKSIRVSLL